MSKNACKNASKNACKNVSKIACKNASFFASKNASFFFKKKKKGGIIREPTVPLIHHKIITIFIYNFTSFRPPRKTRFLTSSKKRNAT